MRSQGGNSYKSGRRETKEKEVYCNSPTASVYLENSQSGALATTKSTEELAWQAFHGKNKNMLKSKQEENEYSRTNCKSYSEKKSRK